jgi:hypothetical protein
VASWFETREDALLTTRVENLIPGVGPGLDPGLARVLKTSSSRLEDLIQRRREAPSRRMKPPAWKRLYSGELDLDQIAFFEVVVFLVPVPNRESAWIRPFPQNR